MTYNQQVPEISRIVNLLLHPKSRLLANETWRIIRISGTCRHLIRQMNIKHILSKYMVFEKCLHSNNVSSVDLILYDRSACVDYINDNGSKNQKY